MHQFWKGFKLKGFFYALRASVACLWILEREEMPPIEFTKMVKQLDLQTNLVTRINELIQLKSTVGEKYMHSGEAELFDFIQSCINSSESEAQKLPGKKSQMSDLNEFFRKTLG